MSNARSKKKIKQTSKNPGMWNLKFPMIYLLVLLNRQCDYVQFYYSMTHETEMQQKLECKGRREGDLFTTVG